MSAVWDLLVALGLPKEFATGLVLVAILLLLIGHLALKGIGLALAFRLSRRAVERGYPVEAASGREFYFRIPARGASSELQSGIGKPQPTASGARLRSLRGERKCTLAKLSKASNIPVSRISAFETGRALFLDQDIDAIARVLHLTDEDVAGLKLLAKLDKISEDK